MCLLPVIMLLALDCFSCKKKVDIDVSEEEVNETPNKRYLAKTHCPNCDRSITSLIKKDHYLKITERSKTPIEVSVPDDGREKSDQPV